MCQLPVEMRHRVSPEAGLMLSHELREPRDGVAAGAGRRAGRLRALDRRQQLHRRDLLSQIFRWGGVRI